MRELLCSQPPTLADGRLQKHPAEVEQVARLYALSISASQNQRGQAQCRAAVGAPRLPAANLPNLPFAGVRTTVYVQHLTSHIASFGEIDRSVRDLFDGRNGTHRR
jgi:hypothetical protein